MDWAEATEVISPEQVFACMFFLSVLLCVVYGVVCVCVCCTLTEIEIGTRTETPRHRSRLLKHGRQTERGNGAPMRVFGCSAWCCCASLPNGTGHSQCFCLACYDLAGPVLSVDWPFVSESEAGQCVCVCVCVPCLTRSSDSCQREIMHAP